MIILMKKSNINDEWYWYYLIIFKQWRWPIAAMRSGAGWRAVAWRRGYGHGSSADNRRRAFSYHSAMLNSMAECYNSARLFSNNLCLFCTLSFPPTPILFLLCLASLFTFLPVSLTLPPSDEWWRWVMGTCGVWW